MSFFSFSAVIPDLVNRGSSSLKNRLSCLGLVMSTDGAPRSPRLGTGYVCIKAPTGAELFAGGPVICTDVGRDKGEIESSREKGLGYADKTGTTEGNKGDNSAETFGD